jgi:hypothetical protein
MSRRVAVVLLSLIASSASPVRAAEPAPPPADGGCRGSVVGAVNATFSCVVTAVNKGDGSVSFVIKARAPVKGLKSLVPASFSIKTPIGLRTYSHRDLLAGSASAITAAGTKYTATQKVGAGGDIEVQVESIERERTGGLLGMMRTHAHLVPADPRDRSEIQVTVEALAAW